MPSESSVSSCPIEGAAASSGRSASAKHIESRAAWEKTLLASSRRCSSSSSPCPLRRPKPPGATPRRISRPRWRGLCADGRPRPRRTGTRLRSGRRRGARRRDRGRRTGGLDARPRGRERRGHHGQGGLRRLPRPLRLRGPARRQVARRSPATTRRRPTALASGDRGRPSPAGPPVRAEARAVDALVVKDSVAETYRRLGFAVVAAVPASGVMRGRGAVVSLAEAPLSARVIDPQNGQVVSLEPPERGLLPELEDGRGRGRAPGVPRRALVARRGGGLREAAERARAAPPGRLGRRRSCPRPRARRRCLRRRRRPGAPARRARRPGDEAERALRRRQRRVPPPRRGRRRAARHGPAGQLPAAPEARERRGVAGRSARHACARSTARAPIPSGSRTPGITFSFTTAGLDDPKDFAKRVREAIARGLSREDALAAVTTVPARQLGLPIGSAASRRGRSRASSSRPASPSPRRRASRRSGSTASRIETRVPGEEREEAKKTPHPAPLPPKGDGSALTGPLPPGEGGGTLKREAGPVAAPAAVVVRGATIWTQGPAGILESADLVVSGGKVVAVGKGVAAPAGALEIDGRGKHVTPGIIDAHSHTAVDGDVNEGTHNVTAEVRIRDVLNPLDVAIYRELAGGTTVANVLHGSANAIGGQTQIAKWRWGGGPDDLVFAGAPEGIKFALGENPKQSNWRNPAAALSADAHGRRRADPRALPGGARLPAPAGGVPQGGGRQGRRTPDPAEARPPARGDRGDPRGQAQDPLPLLPQGRDPADDPHAPRSSASRSPRSSTCWRATRSPTRSRSTARAPRASRTGGPTSTRSSTRSPTPSR